MVVTVNTLFFTVYSESGTAWSALVCMLAFEWYIGKSLEFVLNYSLFYKKNLFLKKGNSCMYIKKDFVLKISVLSYAFIVVKR